MNNHNRSNSLLIELMMVILFFMLSATVLIQVFAKAHVIRERSKLKTDALQYAQNTADMLYAGEDMQAVLEELGFSVSEDDTWERSVEGEDGSPSFTAQITVTQQENAAGTLSGMEITILQKDDVLFKLPCARFREEGP